MNAPLPEHLRLRGASPGDTPTPGFPVLDPQLLVTRRAILIRPQSGEMEDELRRLKKRHGLNQDAGKTCPTEDPYFKGYPVMAWSVIHMDYFFWADKALVFESVEKLHERQKKYEQEFELFEQNIVLACDDTQCHLPAHLVDWRILLLQKKVRFGS